jgi:hypothetical protein
MILKKFSFHQLGKAAGYWLVVLTGLMPVAAGAQTILVRGVVTRAANGAPLPLVNVTIPGTLLGTTTDPNGAYVLEVPAQYRSLTFSYIGYRPETRPVVPGREQVLDVALTEAAQELAEVVVKSGRTRYRNKDNPAVDLIRLVIDHKEKNRPESYDYVEYEKYEKMSFSLSNLSERFRARRVFRNYQFLFKRNDSARIGDGSLLPVYLEEKLAQVYYRRRPEKTKTRVLGQKQVQFDKNFIDNGGVSAYFNRMYQDIDIYDNNISVLSNQFLSPIAGNAPTFYKFYITDTINTHSPALAELSFTPRNKTDLLFEGKLYVTLDGNYAVQGALLGVNENINLNFVKDLEAELRFAPNPDGRFHLDKSTLRILFGLSRKRGGGMLGDRTVSFRQYRVDRPQPDSLYDGPGVVAAGGAENQPDAFWTRSRHDSLTGIERDIYRNIDTLQQIRSFRRTMEIVNLVLAGYKSFGPVEVGPVNTFYSFNPVEGFRLRLGGRTTPDLSKRIYFETYAAYGFTDRRWKYFLATTYSLNNKSIYAFPQHFVRASFQRDTKIPGQELQFVQEDNFLLSFKRGLNDKWLYNDLFALNYLREFENHFSYGLGLKKWGQSPAGGLTYRTGEYSSSEGGDDRRVSDLNTTELTLELRWAPNETFYQGKAYRIPIPGPAPVFTARVNAGFKGLLGGEYTYQNLTLNLAKRFYLSQFGYSDVILEGGYLLGQAPFPLLSIHRANQTYAYQLNSYNLMNFLEFVSDHYVSLSLDHSFNGFFFNKIPLLRRLKWREALAAKAVYGGIRAENDPARHPSLLRLPTDAGGQPTTFTLEPGPYVEGSIGIANLFKLLRIDLVRRFTYLDHPNVPKWGLRGRFRLDF